MSDMTNQISAVAIKGPDFDRDELFKDGEYQIQKVMEIFNVFATKKIVEINSAKGQVIGIRLAWVTRRTEDEVPISRLDIALAWRQKPPPESDPALARFERKIENALTGVLSDIQERYDEKS